MKKNRTKTLSPRKTVTFNQICSLQTDNAGTKNFWIQLDVGSVHLCEQTSGEAAKGSLTIPRRDFNKLIEWYLKEQKLH